jgi:hypothetical protein
MQMRWVTVIAIIGSVAATAWLVRARVGRSKPEIGALSDQWIAEHQVDQPT